MADTQGRVVDSYEAFFDSDPPVVWQVSIDGEICWHARHPGQGPGLACDTRSGLLLGPKPPASGHVVETHDDRTITVRPNPSSDPANSNSILCPFCGWHGYIDHGVWRQI